MSEHRSDERDGRRRLTPEAVEECRQILAALERQGENRRGPGVLARAWAWLRALVCCVPLAALASQAPAIGFKYEVRITALRLATPAGETEQAGALLYEVATVTETYARRSAAEERAARAVASGFCWAPAEDELECFPAARVQRAHVQQVAF